MDKIMKQKHSGHLSIFLAFLCVVSIWCEQLLIWNVLFKKNAYKFQKTMMILKQKSELLLLL